MVVGLHCQAAHLDDVAGGDKPPAGPLPSTIFATCCVTLCWALILYSQGSSNHPRKSLKPQDIQHFLAFVSTRFLIPSPSSSFLFCCSLFFFFFQKKKKKKREKTHFWNGVQSSWNRTTGILPAFSSSSGFLFWLSDFFLVYFSVKQCATNPLWFCYLFQASVVGRIYFFFPISLQTYDRFFILSEFL